MTTEARQCPTCGQRLYFSSDGRSLLCDACGHRQAVKGARRRPQEIARQRQELGQWRSGEDGRTLLSLGIAAAKAGDQDEAHYYLEQALRVPASESDQALAWIWLSEGYDQPADKRECLEQALALEPGNALARRGLALLDGRLKQEQIIDPDQLPPPDVAPQTAEAEQFTCPRCAARLRYTPDGQALWCDFCHYRQTVGEEAAEKSDFGLGGLEQDFVAALVTARGHLPPVAMRVWQCQGCAIEFLLAPETLSVTCPYCNAVYVTAAAESHEIQPPQALIPFAFSQEAAGQRLRDWFKRHKIERPRLSPIIGLYLPAWTFDVSGQLRWRGLAQEGDGWTPRSGSEHFFYDDWLVSAEKKLPSHLAKGLRDFDLAGLVPYDGRYLADWPAERYQVTLADASLLARRQIAQAVQRRPAKTAGDIIFDVHISPGGLTIESFKLILLPVWIAHYGVGDTVYDVLINGQSGAVRGQREMGAVSKLVAWLKGEA
jgi:DNA-directed RNA polymerase subunit RPC12/RpoP